MTEWKARRFWKTASTRPAEGGWEVVLDDRPVRTPGKKPLILPTEALAKAIAAEWDAQEDQIDPNTMPLTRAANSAIEKVAPQFDAVAPQPRTDEKPLRYGAKFRKQREASK